MQKRKIQLTEMERMRQLNEHLNRDDYDSGGHGEGELGEAKKPKKPKQKTDKELGHTTVDGIREANRRILQDKKKKYTPNEPYDHTKRKALHGITQQANQHTKIKLGEDQEDLERAIENDDLKKHKRIRPPRPAKRRPIDMNKANAQRKANVAKGNRGGGGIDEGVISHLKNAKNIHKKIMSNPELKNYHDQWLGNKGNKALAGSFHAALKDKLTPDEHAHAVKAFKLGEARSHGGKMTTIKMKDGTDHGVKTRSNTIRRGPNPSDKATYVDDDGHIQIVKPRKINKESQYPDWSDGAHQSIDERAPHRKKNIVTINGKYSDDNSRTNTQRKTADDNVSTTSGYSTKPIKTRDGGTYSYTDDNGKLKSDVVSNKKRQIKHTLRMSKNIKPKLPKDIRQEALVSKKPKAEKKMPPKTRLHGNTWVTKNEYDRLNHSRFAPEPYNIKKETKKK